MSKNEKPVRIKRICCYKGKDGSCKFKFKKGESYILEISEIKSYLLDVSPRVEIYNKALKVKVPYQSMNTFLKNWDIVG